MAAFALPRVVIGGLAGNGGKTLVAAGLCRALRRRGLAVAPFKKGPDYIDPAWLGAAAGRPANTLDTFLMPQARILASLAGARGADLAVIEGNRGVFDGLDAEGTHSTAELAKRIRAPLVLVVDTTKSTRTVAALVLGCLALDPGLPLAGVILNRVGGSRQERVIREAITRATRVPVLGAIPRLPADHLPARHLGLVMPGERADREQVLDAMADAIEQSVDVLSIKFLADEAPCLPMPAVDAAAVPVGEAVRIGVLRDDAFSFYYPENLAALEAQGATLVPISPLRDRELPAIDALYAGGGYPEEHAAALAANVPLKTALATKIAAGLPVWAECGGLMYLARGLVSKGQRHAMVGALPVEIEQTARPQGHGYVEACVDGKNPFFPLGTRLRGHEFHYSRLFDAKSAPPTALALAPGTGLGGGRDGLVQGRVFAGYLHIFAPGVPDWAPALVRLAREARVPTTTTPAARGEHRGIHNGKRRSHRNRRGRIHPGACQVD